MTGLYQAVLREHCILNTRPAHQQAGLQGLLEAQGAQVLSFPSIEIVEVDISEAHNRLVADIANYEVAIFVSRNAVDGAFRLLSNTPLPEHLQLAVIGEGTFQALAKRVDGFDQRLIRSEPYSSEGLLRAEIRGKTENAEQLGVSLAEDLISQGADNILASIQD